MNTSLYRLFGVGSRVPKLWFEMGPRTPVPIAAPTATVAIGPAPTATSTPSATAAPAPDSPRSSQSPPPSGPQGDLELELLGLAHSLYNLGTTVINDSTKDGNKAGQAGKPVGMKVNEVISHLAKIDEMAHQQLFSGAPTMIPIQVLSDIDNSRNPMMLTRERLERAATENQFMNGKIQAISTYRQYLNEALVQSFPELEEYLKE